MAEVVPGSEPASSPRAVATDPVWASVFVWGVWALMFAAAVAYIARFGRNVPFSDDWPMVPLITGDQSVTTDWLWEQFNEHRWPLAKLTLLGLYRLTGGDFRAGMVFNVLVLGVLAAAMIGAARRLRGGTSYSDAFFPLLLLNWGHYENLLWSTMVCFLLTILLIGGVLLVIVAGRDPFGLRGAILAGVCVLLLPLCGALGLIYAAALVPWLVYMSGRCWRSPGPRQRFIAGLTLAFAVTAFCLIPLYFIGYERTDPGGNPPSPSLRASLKAAVQFLTAGFGRAAIGLWWLSGALTAGLYLLSAAAAVRTFQAQPHQRSRAAGLLALLVAAALLAALLGWGRAGWDPVFPGFIARYVTLSAPALCCAYFVWVAYGGGPGHFMPMCLLVFSSLLLLENMQEGRTYAWSHVKQMNAFEHDLRSGKPSFQLAADYGKFLMWSPEWVEEGLHLLHQAQVGQFRHLKELAYREVALRVEPAALHGVTWAGGVARGSGADSHLVFALEGPRRVYAVRLKYAYEEPTNSPVAFRMFWKCSGRDDYSEVARNARPHLRTAEEGGPPEKTVMVWVDGTIDQLRIHPHDKPFRFRLSELKLLVPADEPADAGR